LPANALTFYPLFWAVVALALLRLTERWIHRHLQRFGMVLTRNETVALVAYALLLFPGVVLHELSHWFSARLMGIRTGRISLLPARGRDGQLQLGSVEYQADGLDPVRESLVGAAPLITGCVALLVIANHLFGVTAATEAFTSGELGAIWDLLVSGFRKPDFWVWFYLVFTIANAMMPSPADRRAWPTFLAILALVLVALLILGIGDWLLPRLADALVALSGTLATTWTLTVGVNLLILGSLRIGEGVVVAVRRR
jgi:hypothetical protein